MIVYILAALLGGWHWKRQMPLDEQKFKLQARMRFAGQPVNWNARAVIWSGADRREPLRRLVGKAASKLTSKRGWRYRLHLWLFRCIDDRQRTYRGRGALLARKLLNTQADVAARDAWALANRHWQAKERERA